MFAIDTGSTGSKGPWISWTSNGSAEKGFAPRSWVLREKPEGATSSVNTVVPAFVNGCVLDLDTLQLGWEKDGAKGMAPERRWNPSPAVQTPRPDEGKKATGAFAWTRAVSVRMAIGGGKAATWEQGSYAAYEAFANLAKQITSQWSASSQNGLLLPLVKQTSVEKKDLPNGSANIPVLTIVQWIARPDCLKADAPVIATGIASMPKPQPAYTPPPAAAASVPSDIAF